MEVMATTGASAGNTIAVMEADEKRGEPTDGESEISNVIVEEEFAAAWGAKPARTLCCSDCCANVMLQVAL